jgi:hypothetical protein
MNERVDQGATHNYPWEFVEIRSKLTRILHEFFAQGRFSLYDLLQMVAPFIEK